jgi:hypothetical protein
MTQQVYNQPMFTYVTGVDLNATGDTIILTPAVPIDVFRWGFIANAAIDVTAGEVALDHRPLVASDTGRVQVQTMTFGAAQNIVQGEMYFADIVLANAQAAGDDTLSGGTTPQTSLVDTAPDGPFRCDPGGQMVIEVVGAFDGAGTAVFFIEYWQLTLANMLAAATRLNFKGSGDTANL